MLGSERTDRGTLGPPRGVDPDWAMTRDAVNGQAT